MRGRSQISAEGPVEEPVHDEVEEIRIDFVPGSIELVGDSHQIFDDGDHLVERESDAALVGHGSRGASSAGVAQLPHVFDSKRADAAGEILCVEAAAAHRLNEFLGSQATGSEGVGR